MFGVIVADFVRSESNIQYQQGMGGVQPNRPNTESLFEKRTGTPFEVLADFDLVEPVYKVAPTYTGYSL